MPKLKQADRRACIRVPGSYPLALWDNQGRFVARGRTANISETGVLALFPTGRPLHADADVEVEMELPHSPEHPRMTRTVRYRARVVRVDPMGQWHGVAIELDEKLA